MCKSRLFSVGLDGGTYGSGSSCKVAPPCGPTVRTSFAMRRNKHRKPERHSQTMGYAKSARHFRGLANDTYSLFDPFRSAIFVVKAGKFSVVGICRDDLLRVGRTATSSPCVSARASDEAACRCFPWAKCPRSACRCEVGSQQSSRPPSQPVYRLPAAGSECFCLGRRRTATLPRSLGLSHRSKEARQAGLSCL